MEPLYRSPRCNNREIMRMKKNEGSWKPTRRYAQDSKIFLLSAVSLESINSKKFNQQLQRSCGETKRTRRISCKRCVLVSSKEARTCKTRWSHILIHYNGQSSLFSLPLLQLCTSAAASLKSEALLICSVVLTLPPTWLCSKLVVPAKQGKSKLFLQG